MAKAGSGYILQAGDGRLSDTVTFLRADIMIEGNRRHPVTGTPQGGIISPLLANFY